MSQFPTIPLTDAEHLEWHAANPAEGYQLFVVTRIPSLDVDMRARLINELNHIGWPLHLRSEATANSKLDPGAPWAREDITALLLLRNVFRLTPAVIARVFFEGRTEADIDQKVAEENAPGA